MLNLGSFRKLVEDHQQQQQQQQLDNAPQTAPRASTTPLKNYTLKELLGEEDDGGGGNDVAAAAAAAEKAEKKLKAAVTQGKVCFLTFGEAVGGVKARYSSGDGPLQRLHQPQHLQLKLHFTNARHTSHVTRHTSHVTRHTSHATRHTSHFTRHTSHVTRHS